MIDLLTRTSARGFARNVQGIGMAGADVYFLPKKGDLVKTGRTQGEWKLLRKGVALAGEGVVFRIESISDSLVIFFGNDGRLTVLDPSGPFDMSQARGYAFARRSGRLLVWRSDDIGILDLGIPTIG